MTQIIIMVVAIGVITYGAIDLIFRLTGINKKHDITMERLTINFIDTMKKLHTASAGLGIMNDAPDMTYFVQCYPGIYNKLRGKIKLCLFKHEYSITENVRVDKSRQFLIVSKEQFFFMQLKGWIGTKDRDKAVRAIRYLKEMVSLP